MPPPSRTSTLAARRITRNDILRNIKCLVHKACATYQKQTLAVVFVLLETISIILDIFGKNTWDFSLASFLLSAFAFVMTLYSAFFIERGIWDRLTAVEIVFSFTQLIVAYIDMITKILRIKINFNYKASAYSLAFAMIVLVYAFKTNKMSPPTDFSVSSVPKCDGSPSTEPTTDPIDSSSIPECSGSPEQAQAKEIDSDLPGGSTLSINENPRSDGSDGVSKENLDKFFETLRKRNTVPRWTKTVRVHDPESIDDDGYSWRKYGQKDIFGAKHPRSYYRCNGYSQGCPAKKRVQRSDEDPTILEVIYDGVHTCSTGSTEGGPTTELGVESGLKLE